ncbi:MAG: hypothetical protein ACREUR_06630 [Nitrosospira sp.]
MDVNRRNLMKGVLTGGTLLALGIPGISSGAFAGTPARTAGRFGLLLGNTRVDAEFAAGVRTAYTTWAGVEASAGGGWGAQQVIKLKGGLLNDYEKAAELLEQSRDTRWIAVMDDGSAAVFTELARNAGARLILRGVHASSGNNASQRGLSRGRIPELRHVWAAASPAHSAGGILASQLVANQDSFSIVENFFSAGHSSAQAHAGSATTNAFAPGFLAYRLDGPDAIQLHCSGLSLSDGCESLGWNTAGRWTPVSRRMHAPEAPASARRWHGQPQSAGWVESVGYAVMAAAAGTDALQEPCSSRAFVHRSAMGKQGERIGPAERFASFVIDI